MTDRGYEGPPIDATEQYISERPEIEYATDAEPEGSISANFGLPEDVNPSNETRRKVCEAAADPTRDWDRLEDIDREVVPEMCHGYAARVLREEWPAKHEEIKTGEDCDSDGWELTPSVLCNMRLRVLEGETRSEIAESCPRTASTVAKYIRGIRREKVSQECDIPPLERGELPDGWVFEDGEVSTVDSASDDTEMSEDKTEEAKTGVKSINVDDPPNNDDSDVRWGAAALIAGVAAVVWWLAGGRQ